MSATNWNDAYTEKTVAQRSWSQQVPSESLASIARAMLQPDDPIIDVGGGASLLVDELLARGHTDVTVLDIADAALAEARSRITAAGDDANITWIAADITTWQPTRQYALWHDRAVFHFLVDPADQATYVRAATEAVRPGGSLVIATFAPSGPEMCSGLPVQRWSGDGLVERFGAGFECLQVSESAHITPWESVQPFTWVELRRRLDTP